jgi:hypothetical protein
MQRTLSVIANPYHVIDHNNRPACVVPVPGALGRFIGATVNHEETVKTASKEQMVRSGGKVVYDFFADADGKLKPQKLPADGQTLGGLRASILDGAILAADLETAAMVGLSAKAFKDPYAQLKDERDAAVARMVAEGRKPGAWATDDKFFAPAPAEQESKPAAQATAEQPKAEAEPAPKPQRKGAEKDSTQ